MSARDDESRVLADLDRRTLIHPFTPLQSYAAGETEDPYIVTGASGLRIRDMAGRELIDAFAGVYCVHAGYGRREIADAIDAQARALAYYHSYSGFSSRPAIDLAAKVLELMPEGMQRVYFGLSGSDANETQLKIVWYYNNVLGRPQKKKIISRWRGYHGGTVMAGSLTGLDTYHRAFDLPQGPILHTLTPHYFWHAEDGVSERDYARECAAKLDATIQLEGADTVAAFIAEPVMGTGGIIPPPEGYWEEIQKVLAKHDVLLIVDEVVCGFGRLGTRTGCERYGIRPDLITLGKGLSSGYLPISAAVIGDKVWHVLQQGTERFGAFAHGYTFSAHPLCAAAGLANLELLERDGLYAHVREDAGPYLLQCLKQTFEGRPFVAEVRGEGLLAAIEFAQDPDARIRFEAARRAGPRLAAACLEAGVIVRALPHGDILGFAPPLIATRADIDEIVGKVAAAVAKVTPTL